jgi:hypothetical protein
VTVGNLLQADDVAVRNQAFAAITEPDALLGVKQMLSSDSQSTARETACLLAGHIVKHVTQAASAVVVERQLAVVSAFTEADALQELQQQLSNSSSSELIKQNACYIAAHLYVLSDPVQRQAVAAALLAPGARAELMQLLCSTSRSFEDNSACCLVCTLLNGRVTPVTQQIVSALSAQGVPSMLVQKLRSNSWIAQKNAVEVVWGVLQHSGDLQVHLAFAQPALITCLNELAGSSNSVAVQRASDVLRRLSAAKLMAAGQVAAAPAPAAASNGAAAAAAALAAMLGRSNLQGARGSLNAMHQSGSSRPAEPNASQQGSVSTTSKRARNSSD